MIDRQMTRTARIAGLLWLACIILGVPGYLLMRPLLAMGGATTAVTSLDGSELPIRIGIVLNLLSGVVYLGATGLLYRLLKPVSAGAAFCAACFGVTGIATGAVATLIATTAVSATQLVSLSIQIMERQTVIGMVFFGVQCAIIGVLIARSTFLPKKVGLLLAAGGSTYVIGSLTALLAPAAGARVFPIVMAIALIGEGTVAVMLATRGLALGEIMRGSRTARGLSNI
jgi:hypothetical protein